MKKLLVKILFAGILLTNLSFSQWSTDPNNNLIVGYGLNPEICSDSAGGCYITYEYGTTGYPRKLAVERLDRFGYKPWGTLKQILGELPQQWYAEIIEDGEGGVIVSYEDNEIPSFTTRVRVQRVDSSGNFLWGQTGVRVTTEEINHGVQRLVSDGNGGCIVVWPNQLQDYTYDYRANKINNLGERAWSDTGIFLENSIYTDPASIVRASDGNYYIKIRENLYRIRENGEIVRKDSVMLEFGHIVPDPEGGIVLSNKVWTGMIQKLVAQRKDSLGNNLWQEPYVVIADSLGLGSFRIGINNRIINYAWLGTHNGQKDIPFFQAINMDGNIVYQNKILLSEDPSGTTLIGIISSYYNNTIFSWSVSGEINSVFAQMYDTLGNKLWNENGVIVANPNILYQSFTTDDNGGFIVGGIINNFTVVAQQVSKYGNLGELITNISYEENKQIEKELKLFQNFQNPFNPTTNIKFSVPKQTRIKLNLYNILGELVQTITEGLYEAGYYEVNFNAQNLPSGIYIYRIEGSQFIQSKKMILIK